MRDALALSRYLARHAEKDLPDCPVTDATWRRVLVIPAYRESPSLLERLAQQQPGSARLLVILLLNRPDHDPDERANMALREAAAALPATGQHPCLHRLCEAVDLFLFDLELSRGTTPTQQGVGLVRKTGCDLALQWIARGAINSNWLCCTDADDTLPDDYFDRLDALGTRHSAAVFPFHHAADEDIALTHATELYELRLHHYVLGLEYAKSPYAMHTLGSCIAISTRAYAHVRGIPRRNIIQVGRKAGIPDIEKRFSLFDVYSADEVFVTGTFAGVSPVRTVDGRDIDTLNGEMTRRIGSLYQDLIADNITRP